jgi:hypothetical protein
MQNIQIDSYTKRVHKRVHCLLLTKIVVQNTKTKERRLDPYICLKYKLYAQGTKWEFKHNN